MATSRTIAQLSILVNAQIAGAVKDLHNLEQIGKDVGPAITRSFVNSTGEIVTAHDRMLQRIASAFAKNNFSQTAAGNLDKLRQFYKEMESGFGQQAQVRAQLVSNLSELYTQRALPKTPETQGIHTPLPPELTNAYNRLESLRGKVMGAEDVTPLIQKIATLDNTFQQLANRGLLAAETGLNQVRGLMQNAQAIAGTPIADPFAHWGEGMPTARTVAYAGGNSGEYNYPAAVPPGAKLGPMHPTPDQMHDMLMAKHKANQPFGPAAPDEEQWREIYGYGKGIDSGSYGPQRGEKFTLDQAYREHHDERERLKGMGMFVPKGGYDHLTRARAEVRRLEGDESQNFAVGRANAALPGIMTPTEVRAAQQKDTERATAMVNATRTQSILEQARMSAYDGNMAMGRQMTGRMQTTDGVQELRAMRADLTAKAAKGNAQAAANLRHVDRRLRQAEQSGRYTFHGSDKKGSVSESRRRGRRMGGINSHNMHYMMNNAAYGVEDAIVSYQIGGVAGATRAATNNLTAIAGTAISNPMTAAATIVGIAVVGAALPPMLKWIESAQKGNDITEKFIKTYKELQKDAERGVDLGRLVKSGSSKAVDTEMSKIESDIETLDAVNQGLASKDKFARARMEKAGGFSENDERSAVNRRTIAVMLDDLDWFTGIGNGEYSGKVKEALSAEQEIKQGQTKRLENEEQKARKQAELKSLKDVIQKKRDAEQYDEKFTESRGDVMKDIAYDEKMLGRAMKEEEFRQKMLAQRTGRKQKLTRDYQTTGRTQEELDKVIKAEDEFFNKEEEETVKEIKLKERQKELKKEFQKKVVLSEKQKKAQAYGNVRMLGDPDSEYSRWFSAKEREDELNALPDTDKRKPFLKMLNALDYNKGEIDAIAAKNPYQQKPSAEGISAGSADDQRLRNSYLFGQVDNGEKKVFMQNIKDILAALRQVANNTKDMAIYDPEEA